MPLEIKTSRISGLAAVNSFDSISPTLNFSGINEFEDVNIDTFSCREDRGLSSSGKSVWISVIETGSQYVSRLKNDSLSDMGSQTYSNERLQSYLGVVEKMSKLEQLQQGWDGGKGAPINKAVLKEAVQFVLELKTEQLTFLHCVPLTYGGIQLEWDRESKSLEIEFASPTRRHYLQWDPSNEIEEEGSDERIGYSFLNTLVDWFLMDDSTSSLLAGDEDVLRNLSSAAWVKTISGSDEPRVSSAAFAFNPVSVNRAALITPAQSAGMLSDIEHVAEFNVGLADTIGFDTRDEVDNKYPENKAHAHVYPKSDVKNKKLKRARKKLAEACILHTI